MTEDKKKRLQLSKEQKRLLMEHATTVARNSEEARRAANHAKSEKLRDLRLAADAGKAGRA